VKFVWVILPFFIFVKVAYAEPQLPKMFLKTGVFANGADEITVQQSEFPGYQYIQAVVNFEGKLQRFIIYRNAYTGEFFNNIDASMIRPSASTRGRFVASDSDQNYTVDQIVREGTTILIALTYGELTAERRYVDILIDEPTATIKGLNFSVQRAAKRFLGVPYKYHAIHEGTIENCEEQLVI
jgi:hypothetical protein